MLVEELGLTLKAAAAAATAALATAGKGKTRTPDDDASPVRIDVDLPRYHSIFLANLSRAMNHETPRRRGRVKQRTSGAIARARDYGIDIGLLQTALERTPAERLALLERNVEFLRAVRRKR